MRELLREMRRPLRPLACALLGVACGSRDASPPPIPGHTPGAPGLGAHALAYQRYRIITNLPMITTPAMTTAATGSTMLVAVGRGDASAHVPPTDNKGNAPYRQLGETHTYTSWPKSGTALYAFTSAAGGADHVVHVPTPVQDEITLAAVEVREGSRIEAFAWNEVLAGSPLTSRSVTTTGPATLIAVWWGDGAFIRHEKTAVPDNGFAVVDAVLSAGELVQCAVAVKNVAAAGTYDVTWKATPRQGAQLWLVAVQ
jgi:hypothetical protein